MKIGQNLLNNATIHFSTHQFQLPDKVIVDNFIIKKKKFGYIVYNLNGRNPFVDILVSRKNISTVIYESMSRPEYKEMALKYFLYGCGKNCPFINPTVKTLLSLKESFSFYAIQEKSDIDTLSPLIKIENSVHPAWVNYEGRRIYIMWHPITVKVLKEMKYYPAAWSIDIGESVNICSSAGRDLLKHKKVYDGKKEFCLISSNIFNEIKNDSFKEILTLIKEKRQTDLTFICAKYYLFDYILTIGSRFDIDLTMERIEFEKLQNYLLEIFIEYAAFACYSELKHTKGEMTHSKNWKKSLTEDESKIFKCIAGSKAFPSLRSFRIVKLLVSFPTNIKILDILTLAQKLFSLTWNDGYGGKKWELIARTGIEYKNGTINKAVFIDTIWNIQHNRGTFFDKGREFWTYYNLNRVLESKKYGNWLELIDHCPNLRKKFMEVHRYDR